MIEDIDKIVSRSKSFDKRGIDTLGKLREAVNEAIERFGENAFWYGYDDESIIITTDRSKQDTGFISPD